MLSETAQAQFKETIRTNTEKGTPSVTCICGRKIPLRFAYKCLYCDVFFCGDCAEEHFGKTREQYQADKLKRGEG